MKEDNHSRKEENATEQRFQQYEKRIRELESEKDIYYNDKLKAEAQKRVAEMTVNELKDDKQKLRHKENQLFESIRKLEKLNDNLILWQRALLHEQKNMFTEIYNQIYHIKQSPSDENLEQAIKKTEIIEAEINNLLKWSRDFVKNAEPSFSNFDFSLIIDNFNEIYQSYSGNNCISVNPKILRLYTDKNLMKFIFNNLIKNVLNIKRTEAEITINISNEDVKYCFEVKDNGPGFYGYPAGKDIFPIVKKGTGLMIVERCINILQGQIRLENDPKGGAIFNFCIPAAKIDGTE